MRVEEEKKKESGIDKLIELLNQFEKEKKSGYTWNNIDSYDNCVYGVDCDGETEITMYSDLYSKYYGFIKWLVDNDKIDRSKVLITFSMAEYDGLGNMYGHGVDDNQRLLMILAIQDNPIEFLISVLK